MNFIYWDLGFGNKFAFMEMEQKLGDPGEVRLNGLIATRCKIELI